MTKRSYEDSFNGGDNENQASEIKIGSTNDESKMIFQSKLFNIQVLYISI